jgi:type IV secretory pathway VirB2 component (pilin)
MDLTNNAMGTKTKALVEMVDPTQGLSQSIIAIILIIVWAVMLLTPDIDVDPVFLSVILGVLGYIYGKQVGTTEQKSLFGSR